MIRFRTPASYLRVGRLTLAIRHYWPFEGQWRATWRWPSGRRWWYRLPGGRAFTIQWSAR